MRILSPKKLLFLIGGVMVLNSSEPDPESRQAIYKYYQLLARPDSGRKFSQEEASFIQQRRSELYKTQEHRARSAQKKEREQQKEFSKDISELPFVEREDNEPPFIPTQQQRNYLQSYLEEQRLKAQQRLPSAPSISSEPPLPNFGESPLPPADQPRMQFLLQEQPEQLAEEQQLWQSTPDRSPEPPFDLGKPAVSEAAQPRIRPLVQERPEQLQENAIYKAKDLFAPTDASTFNFYIFIWQALIENDQNKRIRLSEMYTNFVYLSSSRDRHYLYELFKFTTAVDIDKQMQPPSMPKNILTFIGLFAGIWTMRYYSKQVNTMTVPLTTLAAGYVILRSFRDYLYYAALVKNYLFFLKNVQSPFADEGQPLSVSFRTMVENLLAKTDPIRFLSLTPFFNTPENLQLQLDIIANTPQFKEWALKEYRAISPIRARE